MSFCVLCASISPIHKKSDIRVGIDTQEGGMQTHVNKPLIFLLKPGAPCSVNEWLGALRLYHLIESALEPPLVSGLAEFVTVAA